MNTNKQIHSDQCSVLELELVSIGRAGLSFREKFMISCNRWKEKKTEMTKLILIRGYGRGEIVEEKDWRRNISNPFFNYFFSVDGGFTEWSQWSICENPCGGSVVNRTRGCTNPTPSPDGMPCSGPTVETKMECVGPCPSKWIIF